MTREEFRELYPDIKEYGWKKIIKREDDGNGFVIITEEINLNHPDCPIILIKDYMGSE